MDFKVNAREVEGIAILDASGSLTLGAGGTALRDVVHVLVNKGHRNFLLRLAAVEFIDSYGIGELARCYATIRQRGGKLKLLEVNRKVYDLLEITKLHTLFEIHDDEQAALRAF